MKKLGLIGYPLGHSWSSPIHEYFIHQKYDLYELKEEEVVSLLRSKDFDGLNVTIPYKETVIPYLDEIDPAAKEIGAINCIVNKNGKLHGYNTDYQGFKDMLIANGFDVKGKNVALLGSGGASKACRKALDDLGANTFIISRTPRDKMISYQELYEREKEFSVIVNATPVGMKPNQDDMPIDLDRFTNLEGVVDIIANPIRTRLLFEAYEKGLKTCGGFEMLVRQAFVADEFFFDHKFDEKEIEPCINHVLKEKRNIVLIGMPTSGKTTVAEEVSRKTGHTWIEMDNELVKEFGTSIKDVFATKGEGYFRKQETELSKKLQDKENCIISCGGGIIKNRENMRYLRENGVVIWLDRSVDKLYGTSSRPLSQDHDAIAKLYEERKDLYDHYSDIHVDNNGPLEETINKIVEISGKRETI